MTRPGTSDIAKDQTMNTAQTVENLFTNATKTISVVELARRFRGEKEKWWAGDGIAWTIWKFPDGSVLKTAGRGNNHRIQAE